MAKEIKETHILYGKDAKKFLENIKANENKKLSKEEYEIMHANYLKLKSISVGF